MDTSGRWWSLFHLVLALLTGVGFVFGVTGGDDPLVLYAPLALAAVFFGASASPKVRSHPAHVPVEFGVLTLLFGMQAVSNDSLITAGLAALMAVGTLVELYNWRTGSTLLRLD